MPISEREKRIRLRLRDDFGRYAKKCLRIRTKGGAVVPLELNAAQLHIHEQIEEQRKRTGRVRALILKGRQQGSSTYVEARFYWRVTHRRGVRAFILTHEDAATKNLFDMAQRYHEHCPPLVRPSVGASNAKELVFDKLDSGYEVATARTKGIGRSSTIQFFHGSEVAYWPNAPDHMAGVMQAIADVPGTEVILESTSAGAAGEFYRLCKEAAAGTGEYLMIFVPWFWQEEYRARVPAGWKRTSDEEALAEKHGLDDGQLAWRREKVRQLGSVYAFRREYPCDMVEAFQLEVPGALWTRAACEATRVAQVPGAVATRKVVGVDPPAKYAECGIVVAGRVPSGDVFVIDDRSTAGSPELWAARVVATFDDHKADVIVYEENQGGNMVASVIKTAWKIKHPNTPCPIKSVHASKSKEARAEPVSLLWTETGGFVGHLVGRLVALEDELCTWVPLTGESPNRLDAAVWAVSELTNSAPAGTPRGLGNLPIRRDDAE